MDDLISRQEAIKAVGFYCCHSGDKLLFADNELKKIPSAQKKGHWIQCKSTNNRDVVKCSNCLHTQEICGVKNYCAVCGADMMGEDDG